MNILHAILNPNHRVTTILLLMITMFSFGALLVSCDSNQVGADGYKFESKEFERTDIPLTVIVISDDKEFKRLKQQYAPNVPGLQAFGIINLQSNACTVFIKDPEWKYEPEWIGHEVSHCIWGRWHNRRNDKETAKGMRLTP